jgi:hypothetical protein
MIVTATPAQKAECPKENQASSASILKSPDDFKYNPLADEILSDLNRGISKDQINGKLAIAFLSEDKKIRQVTEIDLTNDGIPELIARIINGFVIYKCSNGKYEIILEWFGDAIGYVEILAIKDMNLDGIPEVVADATDCSGVGCRDIRIYEWNGSEFKEIGGAGADGPQGEQIVDTNGNGTFELVVDDGGCAFCIYLPHRLQITIYMWNGSAFVYSYQRFYDPEYRFEAIQDADRETLYGHYDQALLRYEQAISGKLDWWSPARSEHAQYLQDNFFFGGDETPAITPTVTTTPPPMDETEYPRLTAYAMYRMIILHVHLDEMGAAQTQYTTLEEKFRAGNPGHPYTEMATAFWDAYQSSQKMYNACAAAIAYADAHPEILTPLGSDYHGGQSHTYTPADVCPFR